MHRASRGKCVERTHLLSIWKVGEVRFFIMKGMTILKKRVISSRETFDKTMQCVAPLPCQQAYVRQLASILAFHVNKNILLDDGYTPDALPTVSAIVVAPTGTGKTYLLRKMAACLDLNLITIDCSTLAAEGWKGVGLGQRLLAAKEEVKNTDMFERSVLFLDEVDKLRFWGTEHDQGNPMVNILQMYNAGTVTAEGTKKETVNIDIRRFTVILGGAFEGLPEIIQKRFQQNRTIGFSRAEGNPQYSKAELLQKVKLEDLAAYGMMPELLGRIGTILTIPPLGLDDYRQLLNTDTGSVRIKYQNYLRDLFGVQFEITSAGTEWLTQMCMNSGSGARAALSLVNDMMQDALAKLEEDDSISRLVLNAEGDKCCILYEHGNRSYCYHDPARINLPEHIIHAKSTSALAQKLCRYFRKAGGAEKHIPELHAFLECSLEYLKASSPPEDFCFESLEKLARTIQPSKSFSTFDDLMYRRNTKAYRTFKDICTAQTPLQLIHDLQMIMEYLEQRHQKEVVKFKLK